MSKNKRDRKGIYILLGCFIAIAFMVALGARKTEPDFDCGTPPAHVVVLIDLTDPINAEEENHIDDWTLRAARDLPVGGKLSVMTFDGDSPGGDSKIVHELFARCRPKRGDEANPLTETESVLKRKYEEEFHDPLMAALDGLATQSMSDTSPIMEAIRNVARSHSLSTTTGHRTLFLVSDFIHHVPSEFSQYREPLPWDEFRTGKFADYYKEIRSDLSGIEVLPRIVSRDSDIQGNAHAEFWESFFADAGARAVVRPLL